ncbi:MAG: LysR family transcriptional regulator [Oscillospiraceae bacterium]
MTIRHLLIFISVVENKTMSAAAEKLYLTQPTVSQVIKELEEHYQTPLFDRLSKKLFLTEAGQQLLFYAKQVVSMFDETENRMLDSTMRNRLRIGATLTVGSSVMIDIVHSLNELYPRVEPELYVYNTSIIEEKLLHSELDIALVEGRISNPLIVVEPVIADKLIFACTKSHRLAGKKTVSLEDLRNEIFVLREQGSGTRKQFEQSMSSAEIPYYVSWNCNTIVSILKAVVAGFGSTVISEKLIDGEWKEKLSISQLEGDNWNREFSIAYHKNKRISDYMLVFMKICGLDVKAENGDIC